MTKSNREMDDKRFALDGAVWIVGLVGALISFGTGMVVVVGGLIDWSERNVAARTLWGVVAMAVAMLSPVYLAWLLLRRPRFAALSTGGRWAIAIGIPLALVLIPIGFAILGSLVGGPIVIP